MQCRCIPDRESWWPGDGPIPREKKNRTQGWFSLWFVASTAAAATDLMKKSKGPLFFNKSRTIVGRRENQHKVLQNLWVAESQQRLVTQLELFVDVVVACWAKPQPIMFTAETEAASSQETQDFVAAYGRQDTRKDLDNSYSWDFLKLLLLRSPRRLYIARISGAQGVSATQRCDDLLLTFETILGRQSGLLDTGDQLGVILLSGNRRTWRGQVRFAVAENGQLHRQIGTSRAKE